MNMHLTFYIHYLFLKTKVCVTKINKLQFMLKIYANMLNNLITVIVFNCNVEFQILNKQ